MRSTPGPLIPGNYLRVRGEYFTTRRGSEEAAELPPRARRIPTTPAKCGGFHRTTSACAENTFAKENANDC